MRISGITAQDRTEDVTWYLLTVILTITGGFVRIYSYSAASGLQSALRVPLSEPHINIRVTAVAVSVAPGGAQHQNSGVFN